MRKLVGSSTATLVAVLVLTLPASAQIQPTGVHRIGPQPEWLGMEPPPPPAVRWGEHPPRSRPEPPDDDGRIPRRRTTDPAELEGMDALRVDADPEVPVVRGVSQFEDSVVVMRVSGSLKTAEFDLRALAGRFHAYYPDEFDYLVFVSNLPTRDHNQFYRYWGIYHPVRNAVRGTGVPVSVYGPAGTLKGTIHMPYRTAILSGPMLHEHLHAWANWAVPTAREAHWGFSSANGQLGGFDLDNLVNHGGGRYSAGRFGTYAAGGNSVPYSPIELYFAGFIPPWEVPDLWVAKDGQWTDERDASDNWIFSASDIETWSVQRIVAEHGARVPDWTSSQKSFRAAVVLLADEQFPATPTILRELADAVRTFGHPGPDSSRLFNFWEATGGRATLKMDDLRSGAIDADWAPVPVGSLASVRLAAGGAAAEVDVAAAFRDPDGDALTYRAISSAPSVAAVSVFGTTVSVTPVAEGTSTLTVTATDPGGLSATQAFTATVSAPENRPPEPVGALPPLTLGVDDPAVAVEVGGAFRDPDVDRLTYGAASSAPAVAAVAVLGSTVTVTPTGEGTATVTVTATDAGGSNGAATQTFMATVGPAGARRFTDDPIVPGVTPVRAVHFTELRVRIDILRREAGLAPFSWTEPVLLAGGVTRVRLAHLLDLREALSAAYAAAGRAAPRWTDASPAAGSTPIRAAHVTELRAAVLALE